MAIIDTTKIIAELIKKGATVELQEKVMQLREEALELQEENLRLKTENLELKKKEELQEQVKFKRKVYWRDGDDVPFCPFCYDKQKELIHLLLRSNTREGYTVYDCQGCLTCYNAKGEEGFSS